MAKKQRTTLFAFVFGILRAIHRIGQFRHAMRTVISLLTPLYTERRAKVDKSPWRTELTAPFPPSVFLAVGDSHVSHCSAQTSQTECFPLNLNSRIVRKECGGNLEDSRAILHQPGFHVTQCRYYRLNCVPFAQDALRSQSLRALFPSFIFLCLTHQLAHNHLWTGHIFSGSTNTRPVLVWVLGLEQLFLTIVLPKSWAMILTRVLWKQNGVKMTRGSF